PGRRRRPRVRRARDRAHAERQRPRGTEPDRVGPAHGRTAADRRPRPAGGRRGIRRSSGRPARPAGRGHDYRRRARARAEGAVGGLKGELKVDADPRVSFSDADRKTRQTALLDLYNLIKALGSARAAAAAALAHADSTPRAGRGGPDAAETFRAVQAQMSSII